VEAETHWAGTPGARPPMMKTGTRSVVTAPRARLRESAGGILMVCLAGAVLMAFFLSPYLRRGLPMPFGFDAARYLDQTNLVASHGLAGSASLHLPPPFRLLSGRAGFFVSVLTLSRLFQTDTFKFAAVVPVVSAVAIGLAAGALIAFCRRGKPGELAAIAVVVGTSGALVRLMGGTYTDNLVAGASLMAAFIPVWSILRTGRGYVAAVLLLAAGGLAHPEFLGVVIAVIGILAVLYLRSSWRIWRVDHRPLSHTASVRLGLVVAATAVAFLALLVPFLGHGVTRPVLPSHATLIGKFRVDIPLYRLPITLPLAVLGAIALFLDASRSSEGRDLQVAGAPKEPLPRETDATSARFIILWTAAWVGVTAVVILGLYAGLLWPAHRFLAFLLPFPVLVGIALLRVGGAIGQRTPRAVGTAFVVLAVLALAYLGYRTAGATWAPYLDVGKVQDATTAAAYLDAIHLPQTQPIVFILNDAGPKPRETIPLREHMIRTVLPANRIQHSYFFVGSPDDYLRRRPTVLPGDTRDFNIVSGESWRVVQGVIDKRPVAFLLSSYYQPGFNTLLAEHPDWQVAPRVLVVEGPRTAKIPLAAYPSAPRGIVQNLYFGGGGLAILALIGLGWGLALLPPGIRAAEMLALAPAVGIGFLLLVGYVLDSVGFRLGGIAGILAAPLVAGIGWVLATPRLLSGRIRPR
jgi:hypothetical protein